MVDPDFMTYRSPDGSRSSSMGVRAFMCCLAGIVTDLDDHPLSLDELYQRLPSPASGDPDSGRALRNSPPEVITDPR